MTTPRIVTYDPKYRGEFARLNYAWIEKLFAVEPPDRQILEHPETEILAPGGQVFFALVDGAVVGTVALKREDASTFELTKMAVDEAARGSGYGKALLNAAIEYARAHDAKYIVLSSHTSLAPALAMYRAAGFVERKEHCSCYSRCNVYLELPLAKESGA